MVTWACLTVSTASTQNIDNKPIDPSIGWESSGTLAKAAHQGAIFSLYLAMHATSVVEPIRVKNVAQTSVDSTERLLASLNHYRRSSVEARDADWKAMKTLGSLMSIDLDNALLFQAMYPQPLAQTNDPMRLNDDIVNNCSLAAQKRLNNEYQSTLAEDNTLMYDVVKDTQEMINPAGEPQLQFA